MNVSLGEQWESFVEQVVRDGRYASVSEVVREVLRLVEEREAKLKALRDHVQAAIAAGGDHTDEEVRQDVKARLDMWENRSKASS